jgi:NAD-dependent SIR2 family protein deacetylase
MSDVRINERVAFAREKSSRCAARKRMSPVHEIREDILLDKRIVMAGSFRPHIVWFEEPVPMIEIPLRMFASLAEIFVVGARRWWCILRRDW